MADELVDTFISVALGISAAVTIAGPPLAIFLRKMRQALRGEEEKAEKLAVQRDALVEGHQDAIEALPPTTAKIVKGKLKAAQDRLGVQSDMAKVVDQVKERRKTPVLPLDRPAPPPIPPD